MYPSSNFRRPAAQQHNQPHAQKHSAPQPQPSNTSPHAPLRGGGAGSGAAGLPAASPLHVLLSARATTNASVAGPAVASTSASAVTPSGGSATKPPLHSAQSAGSSNSSKSTSSPAGPTATSASVTSISSAAISASLPVPARAAASPRGTPPNGKPNESPPSNTGTPGPVSPQQSPPESPSMKPPPASTNASSTASATRHSFKLPPGGGGLLALSPLLGSSPANIPPPLQQSQSASSSTQHTPPTASNSGMPLSARTSRRGSFSNTANSSPTSSSAAADASVPDISLQSGATSRSIAQSGGSSFTPTASASSPAAAKDGTPLLAALRGGSAPHHHQPVLGLHPTPFLGTASPLRRAISGDGAAGALHANGASSSPPFPSPSGSPASRSAQPNSATHASATAASNGKLSMPPFTVASAARHIPIRPTPLASSRAGGAASAPALPASSPPHAISLFRLPQSPTHSTTNSTNTTPKARSTSSGLQLHVGAHANGKLLSQKIPVMPPSPSPEPESPIPALFPAGSPPTTHSATMTTARSSRSSGIASSTSSGQTGRSDNSDHDVAPADADEGEDTPSDDASTSAAPVRTSSAPAPAAAAADDDKVLELTTSPTATAVVPADNQSTAVTAGPMHGPLPLPASVDEFEVVSRIDTGNTCGVYLVEDKKTGRRAIFKPLEQEKERADNHDTSAAKSKALAVTSNSTSLVPAADGKLAVKNGLPWGESTRNEVAAYLLDHEHSAGVPRTMAACVFVPSESTGGASSTRHRKSSSGVFVADEDQEQHSGARDCDSDDGGDDEDEPARGRPCAPAAKPHVRATGRYAREDDDDDDEDVDETGGDSGDYGDDRSYALTTSGAVVKKHGPNAKSTNTEKVLMYGSIQEFVPNIGSAEDMGDSRFAVDSIHRVGVLDIRLCNLDRHYGNMLIAKSSGPSASGPHRLVPIDHGFILPSYRDLSDVAFEWLNFKACKQPFSQEVKDYVTRLDPLADANTLKGIGIRDDAILTMILSTLLLQRCVAQGLTLFEIGNLVQRRDDSKEEPSTLESIVTKILTNVSEGAVDVPENPAAAAAAAAPVRSASPSPKSPAAVGRALVIYAPATANVTAMKVSPGKQANGHPTPSASPAAAQLSAAPQSAAPYTPSPHSNSKDQKTGTSAPTSARSSTVGSTPTSSFGSAATPSDAGGHSGAEADGESDPQQARLKRLLDLTVQVMDDEIASLSARISPMASTPSVTTRGAAMPISSAAGGPKPGTGKATIQLSSSPMLAPAIMSTGRPVLQTNTSPLPPMHQQLQHHPLLSPLTLNAAATARHQAVSITLGRNHT